MLSDNIRNYRKENNMSQDELAEKLGVSRQSISLWETGQTQPTIENIIALAKIFNITTDAILAETDSAQSTDSAKAPDTEATDTETPEADATDETTPDAPDSKKKIQTWLIVAAAAVAVIIGVVLLFVLTRCGNSGNDIPDNSTASDSAIQTQTANETKLTANTTSGKTETVSVADSVKTEPTDNAITGEVPAINVDIDGESSWDGKNQEEIPNDVPPVVDDNQNNDNPGAVVQEPETAAPPEPPKPQEVETVDLFTYCKNFAIKKGVLNGDHCMYQQPATRYGGYDNEYFSISYWGDSDMVEFCLHCPLSETFSINFYLRMRGGYNHKYEYASSRYFRDSGESLRFATGYIDPAVFSDSYPLSCDKYEGSFDGQNEFMEESRVGICDLIHCLKEFVRVENMECGFSAFEFVNY